MRRERRRRSSWRSSRGSSWRSSRRSRRDGPTCRSIRLGWPGNPISAPVGCVITYGRPRSAHHGVNLSAGCGSSGDPTRADGPGLPDRRVTGPRHGSGLSADRRYREAGRRCGDRNPHPRPPRLAALPAEACCGGTTGASSETGGRACDRCDRRQGRDAGPSRPRRSGTAQGPKLPYRPRSSPTSSCSDRAPLNPPRPAIRNAPRGDRPVPDIRTVRPVEAASAIGVTSSPGTLVPRRGVDLPTPPRRPRPPSTCTRGQIDAELIRGHLRRRADVRLGAPTSAWAPSARRHRSRSRRSGSPTRLHGRTTS